MKTQIKNLLSRTTKLQVALITSLAIVTMSCEKDDSFAIEEAAPADNTIMEVLKGAPAKGSESIAEIAIGEGFDELVAALSYVDAELDAGLVNLFLNGTDQYTVFAPTNDAFAALYGALEIDSISQLPADLVLDVLLYHVTDGRRAANSVVPKNKDREIETLLGESFYVDSYAMITAIGNTAYISIPNISANNGIIHVIDAVILPIGGSEESAKKKAPKKGSASIAEIAINEGFSELVEALTYVDEELNAGLVELFLNGTDQFTVFAPTNEAFEGLYGALEIDGIRDLPADLVQTVLFYHVTDGRRGAHSVVPKMNTRTIETLAGATFSVDTNGMITAIGNTANITAADISASNGIIHVLDGVILPIE